MDWSALYDNLLKTFEGRWLQLSQELPFGRANSMSRASFASLRSLRSEDRGTIAEPTEKLEHLQKHQRPNDAKSVCVFCTCSWLLTTSNVSSWWCIDVCAWNHLAFHNFFGNGPRIRGQLRWLREHLEFQLHPWQVRRATRSADKRATKVKDRY